MKNLAIKITNLKKTYKGKNQGKVALKGINLEIPKGSIYGLLGPNGAGKSTLINIIAGLVIKTSGEVIVNGINLDEKPQEVRKNIGIVPQEITIDPFFNVDDTLEFYAGYFGVKKKDRKTAEILAALNLTDKAKTNPRRLSGGMKRRLLVAKALVHSPSILILDEPTAGVDVELRTQLWDYVRKLNKQGTTILLTTHYLEEAEQLCDQISIINHGEVIANDTTKNLLKIIDQKVLNITLSEPIKKVPAGFKSFKTELKEKGKILSITYKKTKANVDEILKIIAKNKLVIEDISTKEADLEEVFKALTKD
jgi:ABC-2 type transport system ATP-binding protein